MSVIYWTSIWIHYKAYIYGYSQSLTDIHVYSRLFTFIHGHSRSFTFLMFNYPLINGQLYGNYN